MEKSHTIVASENISFPANVIPPLQGLYSDNKRKSHGCMSWEQSIYYPRFKALPLEESITIVTMCQCQCKAT